MLVNTELTEMNTAPNKKVTQEKPEVLPKYKFERYLKTQTLI